MFGGRKVVTYKRVAKSDSADSADRRRGSRLRTRACETLVWGFPPLYSCRNTPMAARTYDFDLDPFQKEAIACVERDESVLVCAHTSAGKTV